MKETCIIAVWVIDQLAKDGIITKETEAQRAKNLLVTNETIHPVIEKEAV